MMAASRVSKCGSVLASTWADLSCWRWCGSVRVCDVLEKFKDNRGDYAAIEALLGEAEGSRATARA